MVCEDIRGVAIGVHHIQREVEKIMTMMGTTSG